MKTTTQTLFTLLLFTTCLNISFAQVNLEKEIKITDKALFFDGQKVDGKTHRNTNKPTYDYRYGNAITPHGDCIKRYKDFVFMTWYRGGKNDRHMMLSRYNLTTGVTKTIEFPHRHTGYLNQWWIGETHNTIAVGISEIDGTIHLLYDMHGYTATRPANGSLKDDYFRYSFSIKDGASVPDNEFKLDIFVKNNQGKYKHIGFNGENNPSKYGGLTYPRFFLNAQGDLFMHMRKGFSANGGYVYSKYDANSSKWGAIRNFNVLGAQSKGAPYNYGLYGSMKFVNGKLGTGFQRRNGNKQDKYIYQNGFYLGVTEDPNGVNNWTNINNQEIEMPLVDADDVLVYEPGNLVRTTQKDQVFMVGGFDWTITDRGDVHFIGRVKDNQFDVIKNVHTYRKAGESQFTTSTDFNGGEEIYTYNNKIYLITLKNGRPFVQSSDGGTNNFRTIYEANEGKRFRKGVAHINNGKLYYYMMEQKSGNQQPTYLQIINLGFGDEEENNQQNSNQAPTVNISSPTNNASFNLGEEITLSAGASDPNGNLEKVNFFINDEIFHSDTTRPFETTFTPSSAGTYTIIARAIDKDNAKTDASVTITVAENNVAPTATFTTPAENIIEEGYTKLIMTVDASDANGDELTVLLKINGQDVRSESIAPYEWGHTGSPNTNETLGLTAGDHIFEAIVTDDKGLSTTISKTISVTAKNQAPTVTLSSPTDGAIYSLGETINLSASATDPDGNLDKVNFKVNGAFYKTDNQRPFVNTFTPDSPGTYKIAAKAFDKAGLSFETEITITVDATLSSKNFTKANQLSKVKLYPTPTTHFLNVSGLTSKENTKIQIIDINGKIVRNKKALSTKVKIDVSKLNNGIYFLKLINSFGTKNITFIKS